MFNPWKSLRRAFLLMAVLGFIACQGEQSPLSPSEDAAPFFVEVNGIKLVRVKPSSALELAGQTLSTDDAKLYVLPNSIQQDVVITMQAAIDGTMSFKFGPNGTTFTPHAVLEIKADKAELAGVDLSRLTAAGASDNVDDWQVIEEAYYDQANNKVIIPISHFSRYALCVE
ncbi:MAG: hypothetical protein ABR527_01700 [Gemmatimonadota bacterium]